MDYYERVQKGIDYIEEHIEEEIDMGLLQQAAYMSRSNFYRMFFSVTGFTVKEYIRLRRISLAAEEIREGQGKILDLALKYGFESGDSFSRAFKKIVHELPGKYRDSETDFIFRKINILEKYHDVQEENIMEKYPDIKVIKELAPMKTVYYNYYGENPEDNAFKVIYKWLKDNKMDINDVRVFGYNNPSPTSNEQKEYGYEVCITVDEDFVLTDKEPLLKEKTLSGGKYAVITIKKEEGEHIGYGIMRAWGRLNSWINESRYEKGMAQWLEEHLDFNERWEPQTIDLYMPVKEKIKK